MQLHLLVIKTNRLKEQFEFYSALGFEFDYHKHGNGPFHYASKNELPLIEIYPLPKGVDTPDTTTRLGFTVKNLDAAIYALRQKGATVVSGPTTTEWGYTAIVKDVDGRKIELKEQQ